MARRASPVRRAHLAQKHTTGERCAAVQRGVRRCSRHCAAVQPALRCGATGTALRCRRGHAWASELSTSSARKCDRHWARVCVCAWACAYACAHVCACESVCCCLLASVSCTLHAGASLCVLVRRYVRCVRSDAWACLCVRMRPSVRVCARSFSPTDSKVRSADKLLRVRE